ncbi:NYN domain-containing protein [Listeria monocytogenes]|uniref:NYN domain-containing protein n=1 Tax=Listeria monocytogenes TaxID=1639 RepID=UPI001EDDE1DE|nr:NYN domain-containing protein [Listeria monocytogenes]MCG3318008.1 NYN domain-containing protein [Listeria monocytogenes]MCH5036713.1 NYN domain-containing protein [Listeria monocytogenes]MCH5039589.1 NYN domain-containing protein [Listeria monocytogenes]HDU7439164.1 NYN domain-containing protein [Listeria monocytogenes]
MEQILLVDGYNVIGAWPELSYLKDRDLEAARDKLVEWMAEYQSYTGYRVVVVFDAQFARGVKRKSKKYQVEVVFTHEDETADEYIEQKAIEWKNVRTQIMVATSDYTEQWAIFGQGALRISSRELLFEIQEMSKQIGKKIKRIQEEMPKSNLNLDSDVISQLEKWRRGEE